MGRQIWNPPSEPPSAEQTAALLQKFPTPDHVYNVVVVGQAAMDEMLLAIHVLKDSPEWRAYGPPRVQQSKNAAVGHVEGKICGRDGRWRPYGRGEWNALYDCILAALSADPMQSNRRIARELQCSPTTVGWVRRWAEEHDAAPYQEHHVDSRGRRQPAHRGHHG